MRICIKEKLNLQIKARFYETVMVKVQFQPIVGTAGEFKRSEVRLRLAGSNL